MTVPRIVSSKRASQKLTMVTAYDYTFARIFDAAGVDVVLVGDSLGMVVQGKKTTLEVSFDEMLYHSRCVARGVERAHLVCDLPFLSYPLSREAALRASGRALQEGKAEAVKMEGGEEIADLVCAVTTIGIPVMGHVGLMPQRVWQTGGYRVQGLGKTAQAKVLRDAKAIAEAGAYALVIEAVPLDLARRITREIKIPTFGIGSGPHCDGQILVGYDLLGLYDEVSPKFVKRYAKLKHEAIQATETFVREVRNGAFPAAEHSFGQSSTQKARSR